MERNYSEGIRFFGQRTQGVKFVPPPVAETIDQYVAESNYDQQRKNVQNTLLGDLKQDHFTKNNRAKSINRYNKTTSRDFHTMGEE